MENPSSLISIEMEELIGEQTCWENTEDEISVNRKIVYSISVDYCNIKDNDNEFEFISDYNQSLEYIELENVLSYVFFINGAEVNLEDSDVVISNGDTIKMKIIFKNEKELAHITLLTYDIDSIIKNNDDTDNENVNIEV